MIKSFSLLILSRIKRNFRHISVQCVLYNGITTITSEIMSLFLGYFVIKNRKNLMDEKVND